MGIREDYWIIKAYSAYLSCQTDIFNLYQPAIEKAFNAALVEDQKVMLRMKFEPLEPTELEKKLLSLKENANKEAQRATNAFRKGPHTREKYTELVTTLKEISGRFDTDIKTEFSKPPVTVEKRERAL